MQFKAFCNRPARWDRLFIQMLLVMKLTIILCMAAVLQVTAKAVAQTITFSGKDVSLEKIFSAVKAQTGYGVFYDAALLESSKPVTVSAKEQPLQAFLGQVLAGQALDFSIKRKTIFIRRKPAAVFEPVVTSPSAEDTLITVTGKVTDAAGNPIPGATIVVKGTPAGATTDSDGNFTVLSQKKDTILLVRSIGYETREVPIKGNAKSLLVKLSLAVNDLDETVVIAYGTTTQRYNTGNVSTVKADDIEKQPVNNPLYALQGRVAGLQVTPTSGLPGAPVTVQIRGRNSLNSGSEPLFVIDGLPYTGSVPPLGGPGDLGVGLSPFAFINPSDIESISILKDADATAIYGSRGANGVVLITTKKGKVGTTKIDINLQYGVSEVPKKLKMMNTEQYLSMRKGALANDGLSSRLDDPAYAITYADLMLWDQQRYTDWQEVLIGGTASYTDIQSSVSGGTATVQYLLSGNYHRETTVFPGNNSDEKGGMHFSLTGSSPDQKFRATLTGSYLLNRSTLPSRDFTERALITEPNAPQAYNIDGTINWALYPQTGLNTSWQRLPYSVDLLSLFENRINNLTSSAQLSYRIGPVSIRGNLGYSELRGSSFKGSPSTRLRPSTDPSRFELLRRADYNNNIVKNFSFEPQVTYDGKLFRNGELSVLIGASLQSTNTESQYLGLQGFPSDALLKSMSAASEVWNKSNTSLQYKYTAAFARLTYNYGSKYLINLNARRDGSSRFGPGNQFGNFGSVGAAWIFSEERFIEKLAPFLSYGKLRFSYGTSGNDGIGDYQYLERYQTASLYQGVMGYKTSGLYNPYYHWETTRKMELGLETGFLKDRILFSASFFRNRSDNQLINYPYPFMAGFGNAATNLPALIQNTGLELEVRTVNVRKRDFTWSSNFNFTVNRNKLLEYPDLNNSAYAQSVIGEPFYGYVDVYRSAGVDPATGLYQFLDKEGNIVSNPATSDFPRYGKDIRFFTYPKFYGGLSNSFTYKGFSLDLFFQFTKQVGVNPLYQNPAYPGASRNNQLAEVYGIQWQKPGDNVAIQRYSSTGQGTVYSNYQDSDQGYIDASFVRLKNASLSYSLPDDWKGKLRLKSARIYIQGQNLLTFTKYKGLDPETQSWGSLPPLRTITAGLQIGL